MTIQQDHGKQGECLARRFLESKGYEILHQNWQAGSAEIDLIAKYQNQIIFIEVKARAYTYFGQPEEFVTKRKEHLMIDAAHRYIDMHDYEGEIRFDIIGIILAKKGQQEKIKHFEDAFFPGLA